MATYEKLKDHQSPEGNMNISTKLIKKQKCQPNGGAKGDQQSARDSSNNVIAIHLIVVEILPQTTKF